MEKYMKQFESCRQWEKPFCTNNCPFQMDVLDFQEKMSRNSYNAAYRSFRNSVAFPDIVAALCPEYCGAFCPRKEIDQAVQLNLLEKTCVAKATKKDPIDFNLPAKNNKIVVIGGGLSGLACGLRLASKKYQVIIYEKTERLGGQLWDLLPSEIFMKDIERQFQFENYTLKLNREVNCLEELDEKDVEAIYVATGEKGLDFGGKNQEKGHCFFNGTTAIFAGGSLVGKDPVEALADGLKMARIIEDYLKTGRLEFTKERKPSGVEIDLEKLEKMEGVLPTDAGVFTDEEVAREASRCIRCQCDACMEYCDISSFNNKWPLNIREEVTSTVLSSESMLHKTPAIRLINTCTDCKLCEEVCPEQIQVGEMIMDARRILHKRDKMPGAFHQFWLRDMAFANGEYAALRKHPPLQGSCHYAFFPGCHLGAADPDYVMKPYKWLLDKNPQTGLLLRCCGVPAEWAGNEEMHNKQIEELRSDWEKLDCPILIMACPSCEKHFKEYLPEIETISLYQIFNQWGLDFKPDQHQEAIFSVFDPCSARNLKPIQQAVRNLVEQAGITLAELPKGDKHGCCGFGGHVAIASPDFAAYVAEKRSGLSPNPYITYCINCRDVFQGDGKPVLHVLDLIFNINRKTAELPDVTKRRENRVALKERALHEIWGEAMIEKPQKCEYELKIGQEIRDKMQALRILEEDICNVLAFSQLSKRRTLDPETGTYTCYREIGYITTWLEYRQQDAVFEIINVYTHRMKIELEGVWNGRKTDTDLR